MQLIKFGDIFDFQGGGQPAKNHFIYEERNGYVRLLQIRDFGNKEVPTYIPEKMATKFCNEDDILIARYGASLGRILTGMSGAYNVALAKIIFDKNKFYNKYIFYLFQTSFFQTPIHMISRSAQNGFNKSDINPIKLPICDFPTQHLIVSEIEKQFSRLDELLLSLRRTKENLKKYKASVLKSAVEGKLTEDFRKTQKLESASILLEKILEERKKKFLSKNPGRKYKEPEEIKQDDLPNIELPEGWEWCNLEQITSKITDGEHFKPRFTENGVAFLSAKDVLDLGVSFDDIKYISEEDAKKSRNRCNPERGDILMVSRGATIGRTTIVDTDEVFCLLGSVILIKSLNYINSKYLLYFLKSPDTNKVLYGVSGSTAQQAIYLRDIQKIKIQLPSLSEQNEIVKIVESKLSVVEKLEKLVDENIKRSENLKQSILKKAFEGELVRE